MNDEEYYRRLEIRQSKTRERIKRMESERPIKLALLAKVKTGELTLEQAQKQIKSLLAISKS